MQYTFLMAVHKLHDYLGAAIESVLSQTEEDFRFCIVANNCNDELWGYLSQFRDNRIELYRTTIGQLAFNLNYGLDKIGSGYILRMDADDLCLPDRLKLTKQAILQSDGADIIAGNAIIINAKGDEVGLAKVPNNQESLTRSLWLRNRIVHPACALRVESIKALRGYSGGFMSEDFDLWVRAVRAGNVKFHCVDHPLIKYRIHGDQTRGDRIAYAEGAGYKLREFLLGAGSKYLIGAVASMAKVYLRSKPW